MNYKHKKTTSRISNFLSYISDFGLIGTLQLLYQRFTKNKVIKIAVNGYDQPFYFRNNSSDFYMLRHVIGNKEMKFTSKEIAPEIIVDAGANVGYATRSLINQFPNSLIIAIEPDQENCKLFRENVRQLPQASNIILHQAALWSHETKLSIINPDGEYASFQVSEVLSSKDREKKISTITINQIIKKYGKIDILKMDIEGAEYQIFTNNVADWTDNVGIIVVEIHEKKAPGISKLVEQKLYPYCHSVTRHGEYLILDLKGLLS